MTKDKSIKTHAPTFLSNLLRQVQEGTIVITGIVQIHEEATNKKELTIEYEKSGPDKSDDVDFFFGTDPFIRYEKLPEGLRLGMFKYIEHGIKPGSFLTAALENDLVGSLARADSTNRALIHDIAIWIYNEVPMPAWGSKEKIKKWVESGGLYGQLKTEQNEKGGQEK